MDLAEALAWLRGDRSHVNQILSAEWDRAQRPTTLALVEQADAASTQRAYWIVRAHKEQLVGERPRALDDGT